MISQEQAQKWLMKPVILTLERDEQDEEEDCDMAISGFLTEVVERDGEQWLVLDGEADPESCTMWKLSEVTEIEPWNSTEPCEITYRKDTAKALRAEGYNIPDVE